MVARDRSVRELVQPGTVAARGGYGARMMKSNLLPIVLLGVAGLLGCREGKRDSTSQEPEPVGRIDPSLPSAHSPLTPTSANPDPTAAHTDNRGSDDRDGGTAPPASADAGLPIRGR
jgi:hypothetical protein